MATKLYVGNLSFKTTSDDLREHFSQAGEVESASVIEDRETGRSRGFGFVEMATPEGAKAAIEQFNGKDLNGRNLTVNEARPKTDRGGGGGRGGYGGGRDRGGRGGYGDDRGGYGGGGRNDREPRW
jgi:RNA recognition motif-containing protein